MSEHLAPFRITVEHVPLELEEKSHQACDCPLTLALVKLDQLPPAS
jgi:hypothetical protein